MDTTVTNAEIQQEKDAELKMYIRQAFDMDVSLGTKQDLIEKSELYFGSEDAFVQELKRDLNL